MPDKRRLTVAMATIGLGLGGAATGFAAVGDDAPGGDRAGGGQEREVIERAGERRHRSVNDHRAKRDRVAKGREGTEATPAEAEDYELVGGVSQETLDAIAACESGGDPTAVNGAGYYGKYQFDLGTWQSVGGTGSPAEASEAEQDMRASMLYARAGNSPWPNCA